MSLTLVTLAAATLISEDAALLGAGVLIAQGAITPWAGVSACALGIFAGDLALFGIGRLLGPRVLAWRRVTQVVTPAHTASMREGLNRRFAVVIVASRFLPGTRLALYVASGALGASPRLFAMWCGLAVVLWTPFLVLGVAHLFPVTTGFNWMVQLLGLTTLWVLVRGVQHGLGDPVRRARAVAAVSRIWRWEFWPMWLFYAPLAVWIAILLLRYRGVGALRAANPGLPDGGIVGESKYAILQSLPPQWTSPTLLIRSGKLPHRVAWFVRTMEMRHWQFPVIFKPDVGQRGASVKLVRSYDDVAAYLTRETGPVVAQPYHPGPFEAGVFYYRLPSWPRGRILSITDKQFPVVVGDGVSTLERLVWQDARLRMQANTFLLRHDAQRLRVPAAGERVALAIAGNHCQGTLFRDGSQLITPALEARIDEIARACHGFFIGRFDIRYSSVEGFRAGEDLTIIELNGTTAESTNIYDPDRSLCSAYRQLFRQWQLVFQIGAANRALGAPSMSTAHLLRLLRAHRNSAPAFATSD
jgi:membrane protein DedA with SNARE-associated domain